MFDIIIILSKISFNVCSSKTKSRRKLIKENWQFREYTNLFDYIKKNMIANLSSFK